MILTDLGITYELQGHSQKAIALYERILAANPENTLVRRRLGGIYIGQRRLDDALEQFRAIEQVADDPADARTKMGLIYFEKGDFERAATEFNLVLASQPDNARVRYYLASVYMERGEREEALRAFGAVPANSEFYVDARLRRAYLLQKTDLDAAVREVEALHEEKPGSDEVASYLATLYRQQRRYDRAIAVLEDLVKRFPDNDRHHFNLGAAYDEAKNKDRAVQEMRRAIEINPNNAAALNYLGYTYAEMGTRLDEAEALIRRALAIEPDDGFYVDSLGWVYFQRGDFQNARQHLERAVELAGDDPTVTEHLGDVYERLHMYADALRVYRDALGRSTESEQIRRLKGKMGAVERAARRGS
jgi:tetratricopeptide (TPR) repeat protein